MYISIMIMSDYGNWDDLTYEKSLNGRYDCAASLVLCDRPQTHSSTTCAAFWTRPQ